MAFLCREGHFYFIHIVMAFFLPLSRLQPANLFAAFSYK